MHLPHLSPERFEEMRRAGYERIGNLPDDFPLTATQSHIRDLLRCGRPHVSTGLATTLEGLGPPAYYFDSETANLAIPLYPGTRPY